MVCVDIFLYLTREFYCFLKHANIQTFYFISCNILKAREPTKHQGQALLDSHHPFNQSNRSISNSWFQAFQSKSMSSVLRNLKKTLNFEEV